MTAPAVPAAPLIDRLVCPRCGHSRVAGECTCRPATQAALAQLRQRHTEAVRRARYHDACRRRSPAWSNQ